MYSVNILYFDLGTGSDYLYDMHYQQDVIAAYDQAGREEGEAIGLEKGEAIGLEKGKAIGLQKGRKEGEQKKASDIARQLKQMGLSDAQIMQATGLPATELEGVYPPRTGNR